MKKLLLILLCVPLIFSCGENKVEDEIKKFGSIEKETLVLYDKDIYLGI